jgi:hypothetical protein
VNAHMLSDVAAVLGVLILAGLVAAGRVRRRIRPGSGGSATAAWHAYLAGKSHEIDAELAGYGHRVSWVFPERGGDLAGACTGCGGAVVITRTGRGVDVDYRRPIGDGERLLACPKEGATIPCP